MQLAQATATDAYALGRYPQLLQDMSRRMVRWQTAIRAAH
jgi:hypothetical protein